MKKIAALVGLSLALLTPARAEVLNGIYVVVNDSVVTYQQVEEAIAPLMKLLYDQYKNQPQVLEQKVAQARSEKINELVERALVLHEFKTGQYQLPESIIDDVIRDRIKERYGNRATLTKTLQAQSMTFDEYRQQVKDDYIYGAMLNTKVSSEKVIISPQKIETYYNENQAKFNQTDQVRLRMIVLNKAGGREELAKKLSEEILAKLKDGAKFEEMASIYSDSYRDKGGDRGWVERNVLKKELSDVAFGLAKGQSSGAIDQPEAIYLLHVEETQTAHIKPLADVRDEVEKVLIAQERARLREKWIGRLKAKAFIRYY